METRINMNHPHKILLVEDEGLLAASLVEDLEELGYSATPVNSGENALLAVKEDPPDLVLMDIKLKGEMDGIQTSAQIKSSYGIPVIYLTAHADTSIRERARFTEPYGYLIKPVRKTDLDCAIEMALHKSAAEKQREQSIPQLQQALAELRTLEGWIPICSFCRKIRDANGNWHFMEAFIEAHSRAQFTHSICPACFQDYFPGVPPDKHPAP